MSDHVYKVVELVGSSETSIEDAIQTAIKRASQTLRNLHWFEVVQTRGDIENGEGRTTRLCSRPASPWKTALHSNRQHHRSRSNVWSMNGLSARRLAENVLVVRCSIGGITTAARPVPACWNSQA
jgi:flavin-binding protein dodecin